jgi:hypothetical protein
MAAQGLRYNDKTILIIIKLFSHLNMVNEAWALYKPFKHKNNSICLEMIIINA